MMASIVEIVDVEEIGKQKVIPLERHFSNGQNL